MRKLRCAICTRKSSEDGLEQEFNSLHAQREACAAYVTSQKAEGWVLLPQGYDDGGLSGGSLERPALQDLLAAVDRGEVDRGEVDQIIVYKIDRLTRSLSDFARIVDRLDAAGASFVSVTQSFNTATSMGRLTLNMLLSFAQFEREVTAERIRDKISASKRRGLWMGGGVPIGYEPDGRTLRINPAEAETVRTLYRLYREHGTIRAVKTEADRLDLRSKARPSASGEIKGGGPFGRGHLHYLLTNPVYAGRIRHRRKVYSGQHPPIIDPDVWDAVQAQLQAEAARPRRPYVPHASKHNSSPLIGKLFDETGDRLTPSHTKTRSGKRLRYYVSHRLIRKSGEKNIAGWRLPAPELEQTIAHLVRQHIATPAFPAQLLEENTAEDTRWLAGKLADLGDSQSDAELETLGRIVQRASIASGQITVSLDATELAQHLEMAPDRFCPDALTITASFQHRKRGVETRLMLPGRQGTRDPILLRNIARAHCWLDQIRAGKDFETIAAEAGTSKRRIQQIVGLALLAPDIIRNALQGQQPTGFTTRWYLQHPMPFGWKEQRRLIRSL